jgi:hypothetical protein
MLLKLITLYSILAISQASIKDCNPNSILRPTQLSVTPDPPVPGQAVKLTLIFDNPGPEINDGTVTTSLSINYIPFSPTTQPLCTSTNCPIITGSNDRSTESTWPSVTGIVKSRVLWIGPNDEQLLCIDTLFKVSSEFVDTNKSNHKKEIISLYKFLKSLSFNTNLRGAINL